MGGGGQGKIKDIKKVPWKHSIKKSEYIALLKVVNNIIPDLRL